MIDKAVGKPTLRIVRFSELTAADIDRWRTLAAFACEANVFLEPDYLIPFATSESNFDGVLHFVEVDGAFTLCALVTPERRPLGPVSFRALSTSSDFGEREMGRQYPLVHRADPVGALTAWFSGLANVRGPSILWVREFFADGPLAQAVEAASNGLGIPTLVHGHGYAPYVRAGEWMPPQADDPLAMYGAPHLNAHARKNQRQSLRRFEEVIGEEPHWEDRADDPEAIEDFIRLQAAGWKGSAERGGMAFGQSESRSNSLRSVAAAHREDGRMMLGTLTGAGQILHMAIALRSLAGTWATAFDAYDERFAQLGVGRIGRLALFNTFAQVSPTAEVDTCTRTSDASVLRLYPGNRPTIGMLVGAGGIRERAIVRTIRARERLG
jgi:hypothetical protein